MTAAGAVAVALLAAGCLVSGRLAAPVHPAARTLLDGAGLAAVAVLTALLLDGPGLVAAWLAEVATLTLIAVRTPDRLAGFGALGFLGLAAAHVLVLDVPPDAFASGTHGLPALLALAGVALAAFVLGRCLPVLLLDSESEPLRLALDGAGLGAAVYLTAVLLAGPALVAALSVEAVALAPSRQVRRSRRGRRRGRALAGTALLALFAGAATALLTGLARPATAVAALGSVAAAALLVAEPLAPLHPKARALARGAAVLVLLYLASAPS